MIYSVWDHGDRLYHYFRTPNRDAATSAPKPAHLRSATLGLSPEQAAWPLPKNARLVGKGKYPKGYVAHRNGGSALGLIDFTPSNLLLLGALGFMVWKFLWVPAAEGR